MEYIGTGLFRKIKVSLTLFVVLSALISWLILRLIFGLFLSHETLNFSQIITSLAWGFWFDINALVFLVAPLLLVSTLSKQSVNSRIDTAKVKWIFAWIFLFLLFIEIIIEYCFWLNNHARFNYIALESLIDISQHLSEIFKYISIWALILLASIFATAVLWLLSLFAGFAESTMSTKSRFAVLAIAILLPLMSFTYVSIHQLEGQAPAVLDELSGNGLYSLASAARRNELIYAKVYKTIPQSEADHLLNNRSKDILNDEKLADTFTNFDKEESSASAPIPQGFLKTPKNIVIISLENVSTASMANEGHSLTPYLDDIAKQSLVFDQAFATSLSVERGIDALTNGLFALPGNAVLKRPHYRAVKTVGSVFAAKGYQTMFFYSGYSKLSNLQDYFSNNHYNVIDKTVLPKNSTVRHTFWHLANETLFDNVLGYLDATTKFDKPLFAHVEVPSNNIFPSGRIDLKEGSRQAATKYTDYAVGQFFENAKTHDWFKDTLFIIVANNGVKTGSRNEFNIKDFHIPMFFYAPDLITASHDARTVSQIDVVPTLLDILGIQGKEYFVGESLLSNTGSPARAFVADKQSLGFYKNSTLSIMMPKKKTATYKVDPLTLSMQAAKVNDASVEKEGIAYYQTASKIYHDSIANEAKNTPIKLNEE